MKKRSADVGLVILRALLAGLFISASILKIDDPISFATAIGNYQLLPERWHFIVALSLPWLELVLGLTLLAGLWTRASALLTAVLCFAMGTAVASAYLRGLDVACGCFSGDSKVSWWHVALNLGMLLAALTIVRFGSGRWALDAYFGEDATHERWPKRNSRTIATVVLALLICFNAGYLVRAAVTEKSGGKVPSSGPPDPTPLTFAQPVLNLGTLQQGESAKGQIVYKNSGNTPIRIERLEASCGCTEASYSKRELGPGEEGVLTVGFDAGSREGPSQETVKVYFDDLTEPAFLEVTAEVRPLFSFTPELLLLKPGESVRVRMQSLKGTPFQITNIQSPVREVAFSVRDHDSPETVEIEVTLLAPLPSPPPPSEAWSIRVQTDADQIPPLSFYIAPAKER